MNFLQKYQITAKYLTAPSKRRSGRPIDGNIKFLVAHDTGNPGSTAANNVRYYENSRNDISASAHLFVDDKEILECIPALTAPPEKAWHVLYNVTRDNQLFGADANDVAIGVEYCFGGHINADEAYQRYVWLLAYLCYHFKLDPIRDVVGHFLLDPARKTDPKSGLAQSGRSYDQLLLDIRAEYQRCSPTAPSSDYQVKEQSGTVCVTTKLNIRIGAPTRLSAVIRTVPAGQKLDYVAIVTDGEEVNGNSVWYQTAGGEYFWSGATLPI
jgi:N-acetylmuramoyl-L-alanine amidase